MLRATRSLFYVGLYAPMGNNRFMAVTIYRHMNTETSLRQCVIIHLLGHNERRSMRTLACSHFLRIRQTEMRTQSVRSCAKIIPPVHAFLVCVSFSVKSVTRRSHVVSESQNFPGRMPAAPPPPTGGRQSRPHRLC